MIYSSILWHKDSIHWHLNCASKLMGTLRMLGYVSYGWRRWTVGRRTVQWWIECRPMLHRTSVGRVISPACCPTVRLAPFDRHFLLGCYGYSVKTHHHCRRLNLTLFRVFVVAMETNLVNCEALWSSWRGSSRRYSHSDINLSLPSSESTFSQPVEKKCISEVVRIGSTIILSE